MNVFHRNSVSSAETKCGQPRVNLHRPTDWAVGRQRVSHQRTVCIDRALRARLVADRRGEVTVGPFWTRGAVQLLGPGPDNHHLFTSTIELAPSS